jgi:hypothetical protein
MSVFRQYNRSYSTSSSSDDTVGTVFAVGVFGAGLVAFVISLIVSGSFLTALGSAFCYGLLAGVGLFILAIVLGILASVVVFFASFARGGSGGGDDAAGFGGLVFLIICALIIMALTHWGFWLSAGAAVGVTIVLGMVIAAIAALLRK